MDVSLFEGAHHQLLIIWKINAQPFVKGNRPGSKELKLNFGIKVQEIELKGLGFRVHGSLGLSSGLTHLGDISARNVLIFQLLNRMSLCQVSDSRFLAGDTLFLERQLQFCR